MGWLAKRTPPEQLGRRRPSQPIASNRAFSYHANRSLNETNMGRVAPSTTPSRHRARRMQSLLRQAPMLVASLVVLVCVVSELSLNTQPKIVPLSTDDASKLFLRNTDAYQRAAQQLLSASFSNRNKLTIDASGISARMKQQFPELADVSVTLPILGHRPIVYIQPSVPSMILHTKHGTFVLDNSGRAALPVEGASQLTSLQLPIIVDESGLGVTLGNAALPGDEISFIQTVLAQLQAQQVHVSRLVLPQTADEIDVYPANQPYFVKFNTESNNALEQAGALLATVQHLRKQEITPASYIDVRLAGRVYYK